MIDALIQYFFILGLALANERAYFSTDTYMYTCDTTF